LSNNWIEYTCDRAVFKPKHMSVETLEKLYDRAWDTFYKDSPPQLRMGDLFQKVIRKEMNDGTYHRFDKKQKRRFQKHTETP